MNQLTFVDVEFSGRICTTLLHSIWQIAALAIVAWFVSRLWRNQSVEWNYGVHVAALVIGCCCLPVTFLLCASPQPLEDTVSIASSEPMGLVTRQFVESPDLSAPIESSAAPDGITPAYVWAQIGSADEGSGAADLGVGLTRVWAAAAPWLAGLYASGVLLMLARLSWCVVRAERLRGCSRVLTEGPLSDVLERTAKAWSMKVVPALAVAETIVVPKVVGLVRPTILIPASALTGLTVGELEMIIRHELAHVRRYDLWINLLQRLAEALLFFNPSLWLLNRRISSLREYACDDLACGDVQERGHESQMRYAGALLRVMELSRVASGNQYDVTSTAAGGRSPSELRRRIARLFDEPMREPLQLSRGAAIAGVSLLLLLFFGPAIQTAATKTTANDEVLVSEPEPEQVGAVSESSNSATRDADATDLDLLQGDWEFVSGQSNGKSMSELLERRGMAKMSFKFAEQLLTMHGLGGADHVYRVELDPNQNPKTIDAITVETQGKAPAGARLRGIYRINGDRLTLCLPADDTVGRPAAFEAPEGSRLSVLELRKRSDDRQNSADGVRLQVRVGHLLSDAAEIEAAKNSGDKNVLSWAPDGRPVEWLRLEDQASLFTERDVESAEAAPARGPGGGQSVAITLSAAAGERLRQATTKLLEAGYDPELRLAAIVDGQVLTAPRLVSVIGEKIELTGRFDATEAQRIAGVLSTRREKIGEVLGRSVYRDQIRTGGDASLSSELSRLFLAQLLNDFRAAHSAELTPTDAEIDFADTYMKAEHQKRIKGQEAELRRQINSLERQLQDAELPDAARRKLEVQRLALRGQLEPPDRSVARYMLGHQKFQRYLYDNFGGGGILFQQAGVEAFDAMRRWIETQEREGKFKVTDPQLRETLYEYWTTQDHGPFLTDDKEQERLQYFLNPPWYRKYDPMEDVDVVPSK
ncbi:MAG: TIGR03067 domain-containing protein [Planctomycetales bacterium]|nr:TIGR03067 domain-containing protein [Planctomycetales bacterium]